MVDIIRTVKSIMDAHGAWIFGGAVLGALTAHIHKKRSFDADWFHVTCYGCGRAGFSDEFAGVTTPDGRQAYQCVRCQRPDLFKQAEFVETPDTIAAYNQGFADCEAEAEKIPLLIKVIEDDPHDYEVDDLLLIVDGEVREVSGNTEMDSWIPMVTIFHTTSSPSIWSIPTRSPSKMRTMANPLMRRTSTTPRSSTVSVSPTSITVTTLVRIITTAPWIVPWSTSITSSQPTIGMA